MSPLERFNNYRFICRPIVGALIRFYSPFCSYKEMLHWGEIGLWEACIKYQEGPQGERFEYYASQRIRGSIIDEIRRSFPFSRRKAKNRPVIINIDELSAISNQQSARGESVVGSRHSAVGSWESEVGLWSQESMDNTLDRKTTTARVLSCMKYLSAREQKIIELYFWHDLLSKEIADQFGVSEPRVCQIKTKALKKLALLMTTSDPRQDDSR